MKILVIAVAFIIFLSSCASVYHPLRPDTAYYPVKTSDSGVDFYYKHGVLREYHNKKYAKREDKKAIRVASVKIVNNTGKKLIIGENLFFYSGESQLFLLEPRIVHQQLKQGVAIYVLYMLFSFATYNRYDAYGNVESSVPVGLVLGPGLTVGNMAVAGTANQSFLEELNQFSLINKTIEPGQTVYGLIAVRDIGFTPISVKVKDQQVTVN
jgi:hypothetical protein